MTHSPSPVIWPKSKTVEDTPDHQQGGGGYAWIRYSVLSSETISPLAKVCFAWMTCYPREREDLRVIDMIELNPGSDPDQVTVAMIELVSMGAIRACEFEDPSNPGYEIVW